MYISIDRSCLNQLLPLSVCRCGVVCCWSVGRLQRLLSVSPGASAAGPSDANILRRRAAWLVGRWVPKLPNQLRPVLYESLVSMLGSDPDIVVAVSAAASLASLVNAVEFEPAALGPWLPRVVDGVGRLVLERAEETDTKLSLLANVGLIICQLPPDILALHVASVCALLGSVWSRAAAHESLNLLRQAVVRTAASLARQGVLACDGADVSPLYGLAGTLVRHVLGGGAGQAEPAGQAGSIQQATGAGAAVYMLDDALELWLLLLDTTPPPNWIPPLLDLFPLLLLETGAGGVLADTFEHVSPCLQLHLRYLSLPAPFGETVLSRHGGALVGQWRRMLQGLKDKPTVWLLQTIHALLVLFPSLAAEGGLDGLFGELLGLIAAANQQGSSIVLVHGLAVFGRLLWLSPESFVALLGRLGLCPAPLVADSPPPQLVALLNLWIDKVDSMGSALMRRESGLGLVRLVLVSQPSLMPQLAADVLSLCVSLAADASSTLPDSAAAAGQPADDDDDTPSNYDESMVDFSLSALVRQRGHIRHAAVKPFVLEQLRQASAAHPELLQRTLHSLDSSLQQQLRTVFAL
eukprot:TRINITY_DN1077_c0_g1_i3.p1 TRINITY_DN1077_c0_g1~~TRINITY_DN1077_c0_g1_i3.p1  ORF type:complete len:579 (-),score=240.29 TRINITY_DN1077_c0_g1_i3:155-1891(-)